jgi:predicted transcriptional regulator
MNEIKIKSFKIDNTTYKLSYIKNKETIKAIEKIEYLIKAYNKLKKSIDNIVNTIEQGI